jgi:DNA polymerase III subunit epsilon
MDITDKPLVFLDVETTGLSPRSGGRVLEVGALRVENDKPVAEYRQLLYPGVSVPSFITDITGITDDDVVDAPAFEDVASEIHTLFQDAVFVAHNVNFDYGFMKSEFAQVGTDFRKDRFCTVKLSRTLFPEHKSHALDRIIERHGFTVENRHRAFDDAEILYKFYLHLLHERKEDLFQAISKTMILCRNHG